MEIFPAPPNKWHRFAVLRHAGWKEKPDHYDLLMETSSGEDLQEESLAEFQGYEHPPKSEFYIKPDKSIRRRYLFYEGEMSNNRGHVKRIDSGFYMKVLHRDMPFPRILLFRGEEVQGVYTYTILDSGLYRLQLIGIESKEARRILPSPS